MHELAQPQWAQMVKIKGEEFAARHSADGAATKTATEAHEHTMEDSLPVDPSGVVTSAATSAWATDWQLEQANSTLFGPLSNATPRSRLTAPSGLYWVRASRNTTPKRPRAATEQLEVTSTLRDKSGAGLMVPGFASGALGFGLPLTSEELEKANAKRQLPEKHHENKSGQFGAPQALCALGNVVVSD